VAGVAGAALAVAASSAAQVLPAATLALERRTPAFSLGLDGAFPTAEPFRAPIAIAPFPAPRGASLLPPLGTFGTGRPSGTLEIPLDSAPPQQKHFLTAAGELALLEFIPWAWDRYVADEDYARISWRTVSANFHAGFGYDNDDFGINQSSHPFQGALFFEAGRSNGYTYWESGLFALTGSLIWECCMENTRPSINDLVNTTLGGMSRGEVQHRLSILILDNTATGSERFWRELGAALINPVGAVSRLVHGDMGRQYPNPDERYPDGFRLSFDLGYRHVMGTGVTDPDQAAISIAAEYGDPFYEDVRTPFDAFSATLDVNAPGDPAITLFEERGILRSWELTDRASASRQVFAFSQEYEYINNQAEVVGAQMFSAGLLSRYALGHGLVAATDFDVLAVPLAGVKTTNFENPETGRNYDYGPGGGALASVHLYAGDAQILRAGYGVVWTHTVNGSSDNNTLQFARATAVVPIAGPFGLGAGYRWYSRKTNYAGGFFEARQTQSEWRAFVRIAFGATGLRKPKD
jgi:Domain of unknown function (DUF3943)